MTNALLTTKFFIPPAPPNVLPRQRLFDLLDETLAEGSRLGLVCAPAGYGKTTLVAGWIRARQRSAGAASSKGIGSPVNVAWLSLEESENDPQQFLLYLISSLNRALEGDEEIAALAAAASGGAVAEAAQAVISGLINALSALSGEVVLVLDDYQVIRNRSIHDNLAFLIEHLPPNVHLVVTTRSDPPLPLPRYRARGQVVEIRLAELRLSEAEVAGLLARENRPELGPAEAGILAERTEGWPAGVQMAVLSLRGKPAAREFLRSWSGGSGTTFSGPSVRGYLLDYLADEVLKSQPPYVQRFLVQTSILNRFCAPLSDSLLKAPVLAAALSDNAKNENDPPAEEIIAGLVRDNLFLIPLDEDAASGAGAGWFRYHHLFLDLLRVRSKQLGAEIVSGLHHRAAAWLEANGWLREAIQHAIQAGDYETAADLVEQHTVRMFSEGELHALVAWTRLLPAELAASRPWLRIYQAWALAFAGEIGPARELCQAVEEGLAKEQDAAKARRLRAELHGLRAMTAMMSGSVREVLEYESLPEEAMPPGSLFAQSALHWALGYAWRMQGELPKAIAAFQAMQQIGFQLNNNWTILSAAVDLGAVLRLSGRLREAEALYRSALERVHEAGFGGAGFVGRLESFLANTEYEQNRVTEAEALAQSSLRHNRYWNNPNHTAHAWWTLAHICLGQGDLAGAEQALAEAEQIAGGRAVVPSVKAIIGALRARLWVEQGDLVRAAEFLESQRAALNSPGYLNTEMGGVLGLAAARVMLALGEEAAALSLLAQLEQAARGGGRKNALIETLSFKASAAAREEARAALLEALSTGCPQGYTRVFLDEGESLRKRLVETQAWLKRAGSPADAPRLAAWIERLLELSEAEQPEPGLEPAPPAESPLTGRELEILRAIAEGLSNQEIGRRLYISAGTVKAHSAAIYRKLDVANRTEAIARAKDMDLI